MINWSKYTIEWFKSEIKESIEFHEQKIFDDNELKWSLMNLIALMKEVHEHEKTNN